MDPVAYAIQKQVDKLLAIVELHGWHGQYVDTLNRIKESGLNTYSCKEEE